MKRVFTVLANFTLMAVAAFGQPLKIYTEILPPQQVQMPDGKLAGIGVDVVREIQKRVGNTDPIQVIPWARSYQAARSDPNVVLFAMARTPERDPLFQWVGPIDENSYCLWVKAGSSLDVRTLDDARRLKRIGVYRNDVRDQFLTAHGFTNLDRANDNVTNVRKLLVGHLDAFVASDGEIDDLVRSAGCRPSDLEMAVPFFKAQLFIAFSPATPARTVKAWSSAFDAMRKDRTFERIFRQYKPGQAPPGGSGTKVRR